jgi:hypothetical protein
MEGNVMAINGKVARTDRVPTRRPSPAAITASGLVALVLLAVVVQACGRAPWAVRATARAPPPAQMAQTIDPRLIVTPRTLTQSATAGGLRVALTVSPLLPGSNRFELSLARRGHPVVAAHVQLIPRMVGMAMRPIVLPMSEVQPGRYLVTGPLPMFGRWQVAVRIDRPGEASLSQEFTLGVDLPKVLFAGLGTRSAPNR